MVGDLILEILGVWTLVLVVLRACTCGSLPAARGNSDGIEGRGDAPGSVRTAGATWVAPGGRDLHGFGRRLLLLSVMLLTIVSGMGWSTYWAEQF